MIDTHCHLTFPEFVGRVPEVLAEAARHGVMGCISISTTHGDAQEALSIARGHANVWCSAGVHPLYSDEGPHDWAAMERVGRDSKCVAWGELGLDNHYSTPSRDVQRGVLDEQLAFIERCAAGGLNKPIVLHCREAFADLIPVLRGTGLHAGRFVFHCFTGGPAEMRALLDFGAMVSFTGVATYRNANEVREAVRLAPLDRVMIETDAPFLPPEPYRSRRPCEPWMSRLTAERVAEIQGIGWEKFHDAINANVKRFYGVQA